MSSKPIGKVNPSIQWTDEILDWFKKKDLERPRKMKKNVGWQWLKPGRAKGPIFGGCISSMMHLRGTKYWPNFSGGNEQLFVEKDPTTGDEVKHSFRNLNSYQLSWTFNFGKINIDYIKQIRIKISITIPSKQNFAMCLLQGNWIK